jgi:hypothetical protein
VRLFACGSFRSAAVLLPALLLEDCIINIAKSEFFGRDSHLWLA